MATFSHTRRFDAVDKRVDHFAHAQLTGIVGKSVVLGSKFFMRVSCSKLFTIVVVSMPTIDHVKTVCPLPQP
jgi:hypothetical protein